MVNEKDWRLLRKKIVMWQENYMDRLNHEYIELLSNEDMNPSEKFWKLNDRIREDKRKPGVLIEMSRSKMLENFVQLLDDGVIDSKDLREFSPEFQEGVYLARNDGYYGYETRPVPITCDQPALIVNQPQECICLFAELEKFGLKISYSIEGNKFKVRNTNMMDGEFSLAAEKFLRKRRRAEFCDHVAVFATDDGRTVMTMNPYLGQKELAKDMTKDGKPHELGAYLIFVSSHSIYGNETPTICMWLNFEKV